MLKSPIEIREEARRLALDFASEREQCGDPEGADCMRDLARQIDAIELQKPDRRVPTIEERPR